MIRSVLWAVDELMFRNFLSTFKRVDMSGVLNRPDAGEVEEVRRQGIRVRKEAGVAIIPVQGVLTRGHAGYLSEWGFTGYDDIKIAFAAAEADEDVRQILFLIDCLGGTVDGIANLADFIRENKHKPLIAQVDGIAASAAYYIASLADKIYYGRADSVGSIGVRLILFDVSQYFADLGIKVIPVTTGEFKTAGAPGTEITDEHVAEFQRIVNFYMQDFIAAVMQGRNMTKGQVTAVTDGRMFVGKEIIELGLADKVQTFDKTLAALTEINIKKDSRLQQLRSMELTIASSSG